MHFAEANPRGVRYFLIHAHHVLDYPLLVVDGNAHLNKTRLSRSPKID